MNIITNPNITFVHAGLFTTDREWIHPDRTEETYEIICVTKGVVYLNDNGREYTLTKGQTLLLFPGVRHYGSRKSSDVSFYWLHFSAKGELPLPPRVYDGTESISLFKELLHFENLPNIPEYAVNAVLIHILSNLLYEKEKSEGSSDRLSEEIYEWIRINASATLTVRRISSHFGFCPDHITRLLQKSTGLGTKELTDRFILSKAKDLLCNTEKYVKEISAELEFPSDKAFISFFRYHEGVYPSEYRNRFTQIHMNNK